jgi:hypothetical protein
LKKFENSSMLNKSWVHRHHCNQLWSLPRDLNRKFEHVPHCCQVCPPPPPWLLTNDQKQWRVHMCRATSKG